MIFFRPYPNMASVEFTGEQFHANRVLVADTAALQPARRLNAQKYVMADELACSEFESGSLAVGKQLTVSRLEARTGNGHEANVLGASNCIAMDVTCDDFVQDMCDDAAPLSTDPRELYCRIAQTGNVSVSGPVSTSTVVTEACAASKSLSVGGSGCDGVCMNVGTVDVPSNATTICVSTDDFIGQVTVVMSVKLFNQTFYQCSIFELDCARKNNISVTRLCGNAGYSAMGGVVEFHKAASAAATVAYEAVGIGKPSFSVR